MLNIDKTQLSSDLYDMDGKPKWVKPPEKDKKNIATTSPTTTNTTIPGDSFFDAYSQHMVEQTGESQVVLPNDQTPIVNDPPLVNQPKDQGLGFAEDGDKEYPLVSETTLSLDQFMNKQQTTKPKTTTAVDDLIGDDVEDIGLGIEKKGLNLTADQGIDIANTGVSVAHGLAMGAEKDSTLRDVAGYGLPAAQVAGGAALVFSGNIVGGAKMIASGVKGGISYHKKDKAQSAAQAKKQMAMDKKIAAMSKYLVQKNFT